MSYYSTLESYYTAVAEGKVTEVALSNRQLDDAAVRAFAAALKVSKARVIDLQTNVITSAGVAALCEALRENTTVVEVHLDGNQVDDSGANLLLDLLRFNQTLRVVQINNNRVSDALIDQVRFAAQLNTQPAELKRMVPLITANDPEATHLDLSGASGVNMPLVARVVGDSPLVQSVNLSGVGILDVGCGFVATMLRGAKALRDIDLSGNGITIHGVKSLAEGLRATSSLKTLILRNNKLSDDSSRMLVEALRANDSITSCDVADNAVSMAAAEGLQHALDLNKQPIELKRAYYAVAANDVACVAIEFPWIPNMTLAAKFLSPVLKANHVVTLVNLSNARMGDAGAVALATVLKANKTITTLHLANNDITSTGATPIAQALLTNATLKELNLANNRICEVAANDFQYMLQVNGTLSLLNLELNDIPAYLLDVVEGLVIVNQQPKPLKAILPLIESNSDKVTIVDFSQYDGVQYHSDASVGVLCKALRANTFVRQIDLSFNNIGDAGAIHFAQLLTTNITIEVLNLSECSIGDRGGMALAHVIPQTLTELDLEGNCLGDATAEVFLESLKTVHGLTSLNVQRTRVSPALANDIRVACAVNLQPLSLKLCLPYLREKNPSFTQLDLSVELGVRRYNDAAVAILCFELQNNENIVQLNLAKNEFGLEGVTHLAQLLAQPWCKITHFSIAENPNVTDEAVEVLAKAIAVNQTLVSVDLRGTKTATKGIKALTAALETNHTILELHVPSLKDANATSALRRMLVVNTQPLALKLALPRILANDPTYTAVELRGAGAVSLFGDTAAQLLALALAKNNTVTSVDISDNDMTSLAADYLTDMLEDNKSILRLNLSSNRIDDRGAQLFVRVLGVNDYLRDLDLSNNPISNESMAELEYVIRINNGPLALKHVMVRLAANDPELKVLEFDGVGPNFFTDDYIHVLCSLLVDNTNVTTLHLAGNLIGDRGAQLIADTLRVNTTLTDIDMSSNQVGPDGAHALFLALKSNHTLQQLNLWGNHAIQPEQFELIGTPLVINRQPLRQPARPKGAFKSRPDVSSLTTTQQFRDLDYLRDVEDQIFEDAMKDCPEPLRTPRQPAGATPAIKASK